MKTIISHNFPEQHRALREQIAVLTNQLDDLRQERREAEAAFDSRKSKLVLALYDACREEERLTGIS